MPSLGLFDPTLNPGGIFDETVSPLARFDPELVTTLVPPPPPPPPPVIYPVGSVFYGGVFLGRTGVMKDEDRATIQTIGFTVLGEDDVAGLTKFYVWGFRPAVIQATNESSFTYEALPGYFFLFGRDAPPLLAEVQAWVSLGQVVFGGRQSF